MKIAAPELECKKCGVGFRRPPSRMSKNGNHYCSYVCVSADRRENGNWPTPSTKVEFICETCGKSGKRVIGATGRRFCSLACMHVWRGPINSAKRYRPETHVQCTCEWCSKVFETERSRIKNNRGRFCSGTCRASWVTRHRQNRVSKAETLFGDALREAGMAPVAQHRLGVWTVDFYFPSLGLAVEFDGEYWHGLPRVIEKDKRKDAALRKRRVRLLRVPERLWIDDPGAAVALVKDALGKAA